MLLDREAENFVALACKGTLFRVPFQSREWLWISYWDCEIGKERVKKDCGF